MDANTSYIDSLQQIQKYINIVSIPFLLVFGTAGNILCIIVYARKWSTYSIPLLFLSCIDLVFLWEECLFSGSWAYFGDALEAKPYGCKVAFYICMGAFFASMFVIATLTVLRIYAILKPWTFNSTCTPRRVFCVVLMLLLLALAMESHILVGFKNFYSLDQTITYRAMACDVVSDTYFSFYSQKWLVVEEVISLAGLGIIFIGNGVIIVNLLKRMGINDSTLHARENSRRLIAVSFIYLIAWGPWIVFAMTFWDFERKVGSSQDRERMIIFDFTVIPVMFQSAFGFVVYFLTGSEFRAEVRRVLYTQRIGSRYTSRPV